MFLILELLFIVFLVMVLYTLYGNERLSVKRLLPHAFIEEFWGGKERRHHVRFEKSLDVNYAVVRKPHLKDNGTTVNISEGGMKLALAEKLSKGAILDLKISLPNQNQTIEIEGEVVWSEESAETDSDGKKIFCSGIRFAGIKEPSGVHLSDYIRSIASTAKRAA